MFIPFEQTKSLSMRLLVALQSRRASTECSLLISVVPISTGRSRKVPGASKALIERSLGSVRATGHKTPGESSVILQIVVMV